MLSKKPLKKKDPNLETKQFIEVNRQSFDELLTFVDFADRFTIGFAEINFPPEIDILIEALKSNSQCEEIQFEILNFSDPNLRFLRDEIVKILPKIEQDRNKKLVLILRGLERSIGVFGEYPPVLTDLNFVRDAYSTTVPHPILFILPDYAITRIAKFAPDFWAWKSGLFRFQTTKTTIEQGLNRIIEDDRNIYEKFELPEKQERIDLLERLLMEYRPSGQKIAKENIKTCIGILHELGNAYISRRNFIKAREYLEEALKVSIELGDRYSEAVTYHQLGIVARELRQYEQAQQYYQQALDIKIESGDRYSQAKTYHQLGSVAEGLREYQQAQQYYQQALDIFIEYGDRYSQALTYHHLGIVAEELREYQQAQQYLQQALDIKIESGDRYSQAGTYHQLGTVAQELRQYEQAQQYYQQALDIKIEYGDRYNLAKTYHQLGIVAHQLREYQQARQYYQQALDIKIEYGDRYSQAGTYHHLGIVAQKLREYQQARQYYQQALDIWIESGDRYNQAKTYAMLGKLAQETEDIEEAKANFLQALQSCVECDDRYGVTFILINLDRLYKTTRDEDIIAEIASILDWTIEEVKERLKQIEAQT